MNGKRRGRVFALHATALVALVTVLAACSSAGDASSATTKSLTYWSMWQKGEPQQLVLQSAIDSFEKDTGIKVNVAWQGRDVLAKLTAGMNTSSVPDLVDQDAEKLKAALVISNQATDLSSMSSMPIPDEAGATVGSVIPSKYAAFTAVNGLQFQMPYEIITTNLWFNGAKHGDLVTNPPKTWGDFTSLLEQIKSTGTSPLALDGDDLGYDEFWTATALQRWLGVGGFHKLVEDKTGAAWDSPKAVAAIQAIADLAGKGYFMPGYDASKWPAIQQKWAQNQAVFDLNGSWIPSECAPYAAPGMDYRAMNFPAATTGGDTSVPATSIGFAVPAKAKHADVAKQFIAYFLAKRQLSGIASTAQNITPRTDIDVPSGLKDVKALLDSQQLSRRWDGVPADFPDFDSKIFRPLDQQLLFGKLSPSQFLSQIKQQQAAYWAANG